jgi:hypothetical protein
MQYRSSDFIERSRDDYDNFFLKSGEESVELSTESQDLYTAQNEQEILQGVDRLAVEDNNGIIIDMNNEVKNIQGRAFYNSGTFWNDSQLQSQNGLEMVRIRFASTEYFELVENEPDSAEVLSLGKNVRFVMNNQIYEIYE